MMAKVCIKKNLNLLRLNKGSCFKRGLKGKKMALLDKIFPEKPALPNKILHIPPNLKTNFTYIQLFRIFLPALSWVEQTLRKALCERNKDYDWYSGGIFFTLQPDIEMYFLKGFRLPFFTSASSNRRSSNPRSNASIKRRKASFNSPFSAR